MKCTLHSRSKPILTWLSQPCLGNLTPSFPLQVHFGQQVLLVGSVKELGGWDLATAVPLSWAEGHCWTASVAMPAGEEVQFKFVVADPNL